ncbi:MAG: hypothetical protein SPD44_05900, partial [Prevotella sp.]|nr:hypothetical protein [Prevotella sp.]
LYHSNSFLKSTIISIKSTALPVLDFLETNYNLMFQKHPSRDNDNSYQVSHNGCSDDYGYRFGDNWH